MIKEEKDKKIASRFLYEDVRRWIKDPIYEQITCARGSFVLKRIERKKKKNERR